MPLLQARSTLSDNFCPNVRARALKLPVANACHTLSATTVLTGTPAAMHTRCAGCMLASLLNMSDCKLDYTIYTLNTFLASRNKPGILHSVQESNRINGMPCSKQLWCISPSKHPGQHELCTVQRHRAWMAMHTRKNLTKLSEQCCDSSGNHAKRRQIYMDLSVCCVQAVKPSHIISAALVRVAQNACGSQAAVWTRTGTSIRKGAASAWLRRMVVRKQHVMPCYALDTPYAVRMIWNFCEASSAFAP